MKKVSMKGKRIIALILALTMTFGTYVTVFAEWSLDTEQKWGDGKYKVVYNPNAPAGATVSGATDEQYLKYNKTKDLSTNGFSCPGYKFVCWNEKADGSGKSYTNTIYADSDDLGEWFNPPGPWPWGFYTLNKLDLYAIWQLKGNYSINTKTQQHYTYVKNTPQSYVVDWASPKPTKDITITYYNTSGALVANPTNVGTYDVKINVKGNEDFNEFNDTIDDGLVIDQATPTPATTPAALSKTYTPSLKLSAVDLPTGWTWDTPDKLINAVGNYTNCMATYTEDNSGNYKTVPANVTVTVTQATPSPATTPIALKTTYTPTLKLSNVELPTGWTWDTDKPINATGTYTNCMATYNEDNSGNYSTIPANVTVIVDKASYILTDTGTPVNETYDGGAKPFDITTLKWKADVPSTVNIRYVDRATNASSTTAPTDVGDYDVYISVPESTNYKAFDELRIQMAVVISQAKYTLSETKSQTVTFNNSQQKYELTGKTWSPGTPEYVVEYRKGSSDTYTTIAPTNAGTYDVRISVAGSQNYEAFSREITGGLVIGQAEYTLSETKSQEVTFNNSQQPYDLTGKTWSPVTPSYVVEYRKGSSDTYTTTAPTNAGTYEVRISVALSQNYEAFERTTTLEIKQAGYQSSPEAFSSKVYQAGKTLQDLFPLSGGEWSWGNTDAKTVLEVGTYTFTANYTPTDSNYANGTKLYTVEVTQAEYTVSNDIAQPSVTYDGGKQFYDISKLIWAPETPSASDITVKYYQGSTEVTDPTDAGTYDVVISVANSKNYKSFEKTITGGLVIDQAIPTPKIPQLPDVTYDQNMTLSFVSFPKNYEALDTTSVEGTWSWVDGTTKLTVGTHTYKARFTPTGKYTNNFKSITADVPLTVKAAATINDSNVPQASSPVTTTTGSSSTATIADSKVAKDSSPDTSDANSEMLITSLAVLGLSAAGVTAILNKKKKDDM